jgi:hypothetical protein
MNRLGVEVRVAQVNDGIEYCGHVHFGGSHRFKYELRCDRNIGELDELAGEDLEAAKREMHITLKDDEGREVPIPEELVPLFEGLILPYALEFYTAPETRRYNSPESRDLDQQIAVYGATRKISVTRRASFDRDTLGPILERHFG